MNQEYYLQQLEEELVVALGCTEPVSVAFAAALARKEAGYDEPIESIELQASVSIYKNAMSVFIPGTSDMGAAMAAALGAIGGDPSLNLQVLQNIREEDIVTARNLCAERKVVLDLAPQGTPSLYVNVIVHTKNHTGRATVAWKHDLIMELERDGVMTFLNDTSQVQELTDSITVDDLRDIWDFATTVDIEKLDRIRQAIELNERIAIEGMSNSYGLEVGRSIAKSCHVAKGSSFIEKCTSCNLETDFFPEESCCKVIPKVEGCSLSDYCAAWTAAATDARMVGVSLPVMSNSGSGNQGLTATVPVLSAARYLGSTEEELLRAQTLSHLIAVHVKKSFGRLSPLCGATAAAVGASAGIVLLQGGGIEHVIAAVQNMFGTVTGMICDGAKPGCSLKVSACIYSAVQAVAVAMQGKQIAPTDGVIESDVEETIKNMERISKEGMDNMDELLLNIMLNKKSENT